QPKSKRSAKKLAKRFAKQYAPPMTKFHYEALSLEGKKISGRESALSAGALHLALLQRGMQPLDVVAKKSVFKFEITKKKVPRPEIMNFSRQMAVFMKAGIP